MMFKELRIGDRFDFDYGDDPGGVIARALARGPWMKTGPRTYRHDTDGTGHQVGTVRVRVTRLDPPHAAGSLVEYTPFGGTLTAGTFHGLAPGANWAQADPFVMVTRRGETVHIRLSVLTFKSQGLPDAGPVGTATKSDPIGDGFFLPEFGGEG